MNGRRHASDAFEAEGFFLRNPPFTFYVGQICPLAGQARAEASPDTSPLNHGLWRSWSIISSPSFVSLPTTLRASSNVRVHLDTAPSALIMKAFARAA